MSLASLTTLGVGGTARLFARVRSIADLEARLRWAGTSRVPSLILGGGSNLVVSDHGFDGLVLAVQLRGLTVEDDLVVAASGEPWDELVARTVDEDLAGLECLSGIPGSVGATPIQNVGAYGQEVSETISWVDAIDRQTLESRRFSAAECQFGYRDSAFKQELRGRFVVTQVAFKLKRGGAACVRYAELARHLAELTPSPTLAQVRDAVIFLRRSKSMVFDRLDENHRSAGSFFMNPQVTPELATAARLRTRDLFGAEARMPEFPAKNGLVKLSAAWLIERSGFERGTTRGQVGISSKHSLAIVNRGSATSGDVLALAREIRLGVARKWGVTLTPEPEFVGFVGEEIADLFSEVTGPE